MHSRHGLLVFAVGTLLLAGSLQAQKVTPAGSSARETRPASAKGGPATCHVEGVWQLESMNWGGQDQPQTGSSEHKMLSHGHWMWIGEEKHRDTIALHTLADTLRAQRVTGGYGTYSLKGDQYTEHVEVLFLPTFEGRDVPAKCHTEGDKWTHTWKFDTTTVVEIWRRVR